MLVANKKARSEGQDRSGPIQREESGQTILLLRQSILPACAAKLKEPMRYVATRQMINENCCIELCHGGMTGDTRCPGMLFSIGFGVKSKSITMNT